MTRRERDLQICPQLGPCVSPIQVTVLSSIGIESAVIVHDVDDIQAMPLANFIVIWVMGRSDLQGACAELSVHILICNDTDAPVSQPVHSLATMKALQRQQDIKIATVIGACAHSSVSFPHPPPLLLPPQICHHTCAYTLDLLPPPALPPCLYRPFCPATGA